MAIETECSNLSDLLWVLVQVKNTVCALDSSGVEAISLLEGEITSTPSSNDIFLGLIQFRGGVLPIIDLRRLLGMQSRMEEWAEFEQMLDARKEDHIQWVNELKRCVKEHAPFCLAADPHKCAFGKWYYHYQPLNPSVSYQFKKIEAPHKKLHETVPTVLAALQEGAGGEERALQILKKETEVHKAAVIDGLEEMKSSLQDNARKMFVVVSYGGTTCGLLVDEVLAVEQLSPIPQNSQPSCVDNSSLVEQVAQRRGDEELVMILNQARMLSTVPKLEESAS